MQLVCLQQVLTFAHFCVKVGVNLFEHVSREQDQFFLCTTVRNTKLVGGKVCTDHLDECEQHVVMLDFFVKHQLNESRMFHW